MYCVNCGKEIPDSANFCPNCGRPRDGNSTTYSESMGIEYCTMNVSGQARGIFISKGAKYLIEVRYEGGPTRYFIAEDELGPSDGGLDKWQGVVKNALGKAGWTSSGFKQFMRPIQPGRRIDEPILTISGARETTKKDFHF